VTNASMTNITVDSAAVDIKSGSWDSGNLLISEHTGVLVPGGARPPAHRTALKAIISAPIAVSCLRIKTVLF
jgi:hypothetical protein